MAPSTPPRRRRDDEREFLALLLETGRTLKNQTACPLKRAAATRILRLFTLLLR